MATTTTPTRQFASLQEWLEYMGIKQQKLAELVGVSAAHVSSILKGSRRCSFALGLRLNAVTGVPLDKLCAWPKPPRYSVKRLAQVGRRSVA